MSYIIINEKGMKAGCVANNKREALAELSEENGREVLWKEVRRCNFNELIDTLWNEGNY